MTTKRKNVESVSVKAGDKGEISGVFATLDVVDHDGDVLTKDAFVDGAPIVVSAYGHRSHVGELPIGRGQIVLTDDEARFEAKFFMDTAHGRDAFTTVKNLGDLQEWSFSLRNVESHTEDRDGAKANVITHVDVKEVSPVLEGAGIDTRTLVAKGLTVSEKAVASQIEAGLRGAGRDRWGSDETFVWLQDWDPDEGKAVFAIMEDDAAERLVEVSFARDGKTVELGEDETDVVASVEYVPKSGRRFIEQAKSVVADIAALTDRATEVVALRAAKGKALSVEAAAVVGELADAVVKLQTLAAAAPERPFTAVTARIAIESLLLEETPS